MSRRSVVLVLTLLVLGSLLTAGPPLLELVFAREEVRRPTVDGEIRSVLVETRNGGVDISTGAPAVTLTLRWSFTRPEPEVAVADGVLIVRDGCPRDRFVGSCQVRVAVQVPADLPVEVRAINGTVTAQDRAGPFTATSTNGALELLRSRSRTATLTTVNGSIRVLLTDAPDRLEVETTNGGIQVDVPGTTAYAVEARTLNGPVSVDVRTDPAADARIVARSVNGPVSVSPLE